MLIGSITVLLRASKVNPLTAKYFNWQSFFYFPHFLCTPLWFNLFGSYILVFLIRMSAMPYYRMAQNFGGKKLWRIWWFMTDLPKFYPPTILILWLFCCARQPIRQCFIYQNTYWQQSAKVFYRQSFVLHGSFQ